jgi:hypothetical protein
MSTTAPLAMAAALRAAVRRVEKHAPIYGVAPLEDQLGTYLAQRGSVADCGLNHRLLFPGETRNESRPHSGIACAVMSRVSPSVRIRTSQSRYRTMKPRRLSVTLCRVMQGPRGMRYARNRCARACRGTANDGVNLHEALSHSSTTIGNQVHASDRRDQRGASRPGNCRASSQGLSARVHGRPPTA